MWSREWIPYVLTSFSGVGILANLSSYRFIKSTFNVSDNLFNILVKDSLLTTLCLTLQFITNFVLLVSPELLRNEFGCFLNHIGSNLATLIAPLMTILISIRRFIQVKNPNLIKLNSRVFNTFTTVVLSLAAIYLLTFNAINVYWDQKNFHYIGLCLGVLDEWSTQSNRMLFWLLFLPSLILVITAMILDVITHRLKQTSTIGTVELSRRQEGQRKLERVPKRAALVNLISLSFWIANGFVRFSITREEDKIAFWKILGLSLNSCRNFITSRFAFRINKQIQRETVEERRNREIEHAMKERDERRRKLGLIHQVQPVQDISVL